MAKHGVSSVTDGAAGMLKYGRISPGEFQACYTHAIHLAVCDLLYFEDSPKPAEGGENSIDVESADAAADAENDDNDGCESEIDEE